MSETRPATPREPSSAILAAQILGMILENGTALATRQPRPHTLSELHVKRTALLRDPFFDERHERAELGPRRHPPSPVLFMDVVVLMARLMRVLMRRGNERTSEEAVERIVVRNDCLDQPFFRPARTDCNLPFVDVDADRVYYEGFDEDDEEDESMRGDENCCNECDSEDCEEGDEDDSEDSCSVD